MHVSRTYERKYKRLLSILAESLSLLVFLIFKFEGTGYTEMDRTGWLEK